MSNQTSEHFFESVRDVVEERIPFSQAVDLAFEVEDEVEEIIQDYL